MPVSKNNSEEINVSFRKKIWTAAAIISFIAIFFLLFEALFSVLLLILAGILIAVYFYGVAGILQRNFKWSPKLSIIISVLVNLVLIVAIAWLVGASIQQQAARLADTLPETIQNAKEQIGKSALGRKLIEQINSSGDSAKTFSVVKRFFSSSFGILSDLYIVLLLGVFFIASPSAYKKGMVRLLPSKAKEKGTDIIDKISHVLKKWLKGQLIGIVFIGVLTAIGLIIIGMPMVLALSIIAGVLNFIPNFGPLIALIPAVLISLMQGPGTALIVVCMYTFIQIIQSAVEQPMIQKKMINIPPALTIIGQIGMGLLAGFWGVLLATPVIAILIILVEELYIKEQ